MHTPTLFEVVHRSLWQWLTLGAAAVALVPAARGMSTIGWWPYWLVVAPAVGLLVLHRHRLAAAPVQTPSRRRSSRRRNSPMMRR